MHINYKPSKTIPLDIGTIHMIGIGGIGISGMAEILHNLGYKVTGSDLADNYNVERVRKLGVKVFIGHAAENVEGASIIVKSTAVASTNPEIIAAKEKNIPIVSRHEMLAEITKLKATVAISGSHGKTTTTSLIGHIFETSGLNPTVINGGIINSYGSNAHLGTGEWLIAEADESDGTFVKIPSVVGVVTNIDPEHMDYWKDFETLRKAFRDFIVQLPFYGFGVMNIDHKVVREIKESITERRIYSYSLEDKSADIFGFNIRPENHGSFFDIIVSENLSPTGKKLELKDFFITVNGVHNVSNSLSAIAVGLGVHIEPEKIKESLKTFAGVKRRFTKVAEVNNYTIIDDYAHHPAEIRATLSSAKQTLNGVHGSVIAVMQPHRYTRLENLFSDFSKCFDDADTVIITEMYSAGEKPIAGVDQFALADAVRKNGKEVIALDSDSKLAATIKSIAASGDYVVCMGAGSISKMAYKLPEELRV
jgi:UDP-N-acetylmuramate--alanine ligase